MNTAEYDRLKMQALRRAHVLRRESFNALWGQLAALLRTARPLTALRATRGA